MVDGAMTNLKTILSMTRARMMATRMMAMRMTAMRMMEARMEATRIVLEVMRTLKGKVEVEEEVVEGKAMVRSIQVHPVWEDSPKLLFFHCGILGKDRIQSF